MTNPRVAIVGLGYIGLPTAAVLATHGVSVVGVDVNADTVAAVAAGSVPFVEKGLAEVVATAVADGSLTAATELPPAETFIIAVPTPFAEGHAPDLSFIRSATEAVARVVQAGNLVVLESTVPPGATEQVGAWLREARPDLATDDGELNVLLAHCPERVLPGRIMVELITNDRIIGGVTREAAERARELYATFCRGEIVLTDARTAELAKLAENAYRDVNIAFANELSLIADELNINVWELISLANRHPRVSILQPGPGVGGHCIAVDPWFIVDAAPAASRLIRTARTVNDGKPEWVVDKVRALVGDNPRPTIATLGLAFKPDVDDLRESPARAIVATLADLYPEGEIRAVEPHVSALPAELANRRNVALHALDAAVTGADVVVLLVDHSAFRQLSPADAGIDLDRLVDTRGVWR